MRFFSWKYDKLVAVDTEKPGQHASARAQVVTIKFKFYQIEKIAESCGLREKSGKHLVAPPSSIRQQLYTLQLSLFTKAAANLNYLAFFLFGARYMCTRARPRARAGNFCLARLRLMSRVHPVFFEYLAGILVMWNWKIFPPCPDGSLKA